MADIALTLIARNEAPRIGRCLDSVRAHVSRMLVLDTGSTDDTVAVARAHGAQVSHYTWCDDFSAARNAVLDRSDADWNLVLDADEWLQDSPAAIAAQLQAVTRGAPCIGLVCQMNTFELAGRRELAPAWIPRLLPRGVRYAGRVHEQPIQMSEHPSQTLDGPTATGVPDLQGKPAVAAAAAAAVLMSSPTVPQAHRLPRRRLSLHLGHDGYLPERAQAKRGRNAALLEQALAASPDDAYLWFQLGKEHAVYDDHGAAVLAFEEALWRTAPTERFRHDLVVRALFSLKAAGRHDRAMTLAADEMDRWPQSPDFHFALGDVLLDMAGLDPTQALSHWLPLAQASWEKCLHIGEQPLLEGTVRGRGSFLAAHNLAVIHAGLNRPEQAARFQQLAAAQRAGAG